MRGSGIGLVCFSMLLAACIGPDDVQADVPGSTPSATTTSLSTTTTATSAPTSTIASLESGGESALYRVDPATLDPLPGSEPITRADWLSGSLSPNRNWLVLNAWIDTDPDTDIVRVVDLTADRVVTEATGDLIHGLRVGDDGTVYFVTETAPALRLWRLAPGAASAEIVFDDFPEAFNFSVPPTMLGDDRIGFFGFVGDYSTGQSALVVVDAGAQTASQYPLPNLARGRIEHQAGDVVISEGVDPAVVWDTAKNRVLVVHADQQIVTVVDLDSGFTVNRSWAPQTSGIGRFLAWLVPPAYAKGPFIATRRTAVLSESGDILYVGSVRSDLAVDQYDWTATSTPQGVEAISTETWERIERWDIPASEVLLAPGGRFLVASGTAFLMEGSATYSDGFRESLTSGGVFVIDTVSGNLAGPVGNDEGPYPDIQFSRDGSLMYIPYWGGSIDIVDLESLEVSFVSGPEQLTVFGEAGLLATTIR